MKWIGNHLKEEQQKMPVFGSVPGMDFWNPVEYFPNYGVLIHLELIKSGRSDPEQIQSEIYWE